MANPTMKSGFRTVLQIKSIAAGAQATLEALKEAEKTVLTTAASLASKQMEQSALADTISTLTDENEELEEAITYYDTVMAGSSAGLPEYDAAEAAREEAADRKTANDDLIAAETTEKDAVDVEVTALEADLTAAETTVESTRATIGVGVYETVPLVEEMTFPAVIAEMDSLLPMDGSTNGYPVTVPTETFENDEIEWTMGINKANAIHDRLERAAQLRDRIEARAVATDGRVYSFAMYISEFRRTPESKKANRAKVKATLDGAVTIA